MPRLEGLVHATETQVHRLSLQGQQGLEDGIGSGTPGSPARSGGHLLPGDVVVVFFQRCSELTVVPGRVGFIAGFTRRH